MKLIKLIRIILLILFTTSTSFAIENNPPDRNLNQIMSDIGQTMITIFPLIFSENKLSPSENKEIYQSVKQLQELFRQAEPYILEKSPTYHMSYQLLYDYLDSIIVSANNPAFLPQIKNRLVSLSDFCVSCHTQDNKFRTLFSDVKTPKTTNFFSRAEFNFATRNYIEAYQYYEKYILLTPNLQDGDTLKALHRMFAIFIQILNQPDEALSAVKHLVSTGKFSPGITDYLGKIKLAIEGLIDAKLNKIEDVSFRDLQTHITRYLGDSNAHQPFIFSSPKNEIERLWLRGLLFRYLNSDPKPEEMPQLLYWLALCDRSLGYGYDYTLADFYIKQCITRYSSHPFARRCFNEYKSYVEFYFTTPTEPVIPMEIDRELRELESYLRK